MVVVRLCIQTYCTVDLSLEDAQQRRERHRRRVIEAIHSYRDEGRPFETHNSLTPWSWSVLGYPIAPSVWYQYYREMDRILQTLTDGNASLYIHGAVFVPFNTTLHDRLRMTVYRLFYFNTPASLWHVVRTIRFRLLFIASTSFGDQVSIERLRISVDSSSTFYPGGLICET